MDSFVEDAVMAFRADWVMLYAKDLAYRDEFSFVLVTIVNQNQSGHSSDSEELGECNSCHIV